MEPQIRYCTTADGINIAYATAGSGPPVVWIQNPFQSHVQLAWEQPPLRAAYGNILAGGATLVRLDPRGTGLSDRDVDVSSAAYVRDLEAVVDHLHLDQFALMSIEWGAATTIPYAALHPERVSRLVLMNPAWGGVWQTPRGQKWMDLADDWELLTETVAAMAFGFGYQEAHQYAAFMRAAIDQDTFRSWMSQAIDLPDVAKQLRVPTLVIRHTGVSWLSMESTRALVSAIPDCTMMAIDGIYTDHPGRTGRAIQEFLGLELQRAPSTTTEPNSADRLEASSLRTVLFTDLVGHTEMMSRLGDERGRDVLREHERITREVLKANGGTEVKTMGDGFMASFGSVTKAVECAIALQKAFAERGNPDVGARRPFSRDDVAVSDRGTTAEQPLDQGHASPQTPPSTPNAPPSTVEPLSVRVGLNAGEPIEEDGDLFGATVILASRIAAEANGGEILVADTVRGLCSGKGFLFADRGEFVAKGFEEPVRIYEVSWGE
jgi:class 3 adenylate cyclase/pimeloyl-ACP methyl ester carboxylesterase